MPNKREAFIRAIKSRVMAFLRGASECDVVMDLILAMQRWDKEYWKTHLKAGEVRRPVGLAHYDSMLGGAISNLIDSVDQLGPEVFDHVRYHRTDDLSDIADVFRNLDYNTVHSLAATLRDRLLLRLLRPDTISSVDRNDPLDVVAPLKGLTLNELEQADSVLHQSFPKRGRGRPSTVLHQISLKDLDYWYRVKTLTAGMTLAQACLAVADEDNDRATDIDTLKKRFARLNETIESRLDLLNENRP